MDHSNIGHALSVIRLHRDVSLEELALLLTTQSQQAVGVPFLERAESGQEAISEGLLDAFCKVLQVTRPRILKLAQFLHECGDKPETELLKELLKETDYLLWKHQQKEK